MIRTIVLAVAALLALSLSAEARPLHHHHHRYHHHYVSAAACVETGDFMHPVCGMGRSEVNFRPAVAVAVQAGRRVAAIAVETWDRVGQIVAHPAGCPRVAFCGCGSAVHVFGRPIRSLWLARAWYRFPRAGPAPGMAAVRAHHVFVLEANLGGGIWRVYDPNSGHHLTRVHARSIAGFTIVNPHGAA